MTFKQNTYQTPLAGGLETRLPQNPQNANVAQNLVVDTETGGWSTRLGYEPFKTGATDWAPFTVSGPIYSLHAAQHLAGGARQHILYEDSGQLQLLYEASGGLVVKTLATGRNIPTPTEAGSWFTDTSYGTIVTNGVDRPVLVKPWPAPQNALVVESFFIRDFGFTGVPTAADPRLNIPMPAPSGGGGLAFDPQTGGGATTIWCPSDTRGIPDGGRWGLGLADNTAGTPVAGDKVSLFGWAVSFISDTGSEGPSSTLATATWSLPANHEGFRYACAVDIPTGPDGTVARKLYRTTNFSNDSSNPGDSTLYFVDLIRNNVETTYYDANQTRTLGQPAPLVATGPLPAPRARFSALFAGCLFLDGGIDDSRTLYYSAQGLIEQFAADAYIELAAIGGGITALYASYTDLLVFRENSIDVVQGTYQTGFTVTTLATSITCRAPHSIQAVPGLGVVFLGNDGVYAITGGLTGGAVADIVNLTINQDKVIERITPDCHVKAVSCFSASAREYQLYLPVDGSDRPSLGLVLHIDRLPQAPALAPWSTRVGFPVGAITTLYDGTVIFGHHTGNETGNATSQRGLFALSGKRALGTTLADDVMSFASPPTSIYRSAWWSAGDPQLLKQVTYVTVWVLTTGAPTITMRHFKDFQLQPVSERTYNAQPPDAVALPELDKVTLGAGNYTTERLVPLRFSVAHQSAAWFCFEIETTQDIILVGWEYTFTSKGILVTQGPRA